MPYYHRLMKDLNLTPYEIKTLDDLDSLPILTKKLIRENFTNMQSLKYLHLRVPWSTGGSTGEPLKFFHSKKGLIYKDANTLRFFGWAGYYKADRVVYLHGLPSEFGASGIRIEGSYRRPYAVLHFSLFGADPAQIKNYIRAVKKFKPQGFRGYASYLYRFASELSEGELDLNFVISGSEILFPHERKFIERKFGCKLFDIYGSREFSLIAAECEEHSGYHIAAENLILEVVDEEGKKVCPGESGKILITDLTNEAFPFIRYEIGDTGILSDETCSCGRGLPLLKQIEGRTGERILTGDGKFICVEPFAHLFKDFDVIQFQVIQRSIDTLIIKIVRGPKFTEEEGFRLVTYLKRLFPRLNIKLEYTDTDHLLRTKSGKRKLVISNFNVS